MRERALDGRREGGLLRPRLEAGKRGGERAAGTEGVVHSERELTQANGRSPRAP